MSIELVTNSNDPAIGALITAEFINAEGKAKINVKISKDCKSLVSLTEDGNILCESDTAVGRYFGRTVYPEIYGGSDIYERTEVDHWLSFSIGPLNCKKSLSEALNYLDRVLKTKTWLVSKHLTLADIYVFSSLVAHWPLPNDEKYDNVSRWYNQLSSLPYVQKVLALVPKNRAGKSRNAGPQDSKDSKKPGGTGNRKQEGKFIELPGAEMGKVIVRFPPEASGYLHIGHAKAALLNQYYAEAFEGQLIMRFDDTNPAKENVEFEQAILQDLEMLEIKPHRFTHSSDYFDLMLSYCDKLIEEGKAFVDDTPALLMKEQREQRLPSANRDNSVAHNKELWEEMKKGTKRGQECCVRAKIDHESTNGCMRDPTIYRCKPEPHPRTGTKYKVYPTYDFACPIVDAIEGVTHTLRTTEYHDRDVQFFWFIEALGLRRPYIWEYSRLNMTNTVLSKRRLTWLVAEGLVDGWDDPRFPTVRGILRRGMTVDGLKQFIIAQGSSRSVVFMEWDKIWSFNKKVIDPIAIRYTVLDDGETVPVVVENAVEGFLTVQNHPKDLAKGTKRVKIGPKISIEKCDAELLVEGQNATFINWGNLMIKQVKRENGAVTQVVAALNLDNKDFKNTVKLTWLATDSEAKDNSAESTNLLPCYTVYFDHIISKAVLGKDEDFKDFVAKDTRKEVKTLAEFEMKRVKKGEIIQLQRKGFFRCDVPYAPRSPISSREQPIVLFHIPDGHAVPQAAAKTPSVVKNAVNDKKANHNQEVSATLHDEITAQGNKVRELKTQKAEKAQIDEAVKKLLKLKGDYKNSTGNEWKPTATVPQKSNKPAQGNDNLSEEITKQGDKVRQLKAQKAQKAEIDEAVKHLLKLKNDYKNSTGNEWKPTVTVPEKSNKPAQGNDNLSEEITKQGDKVRQLKAQKAEKAQVDEAVKHLLKLKSDYKNSTGNEWKPTATVPEKSNKPAQGNDNLSEEITKQGDKVRQLKAQKAEKAQVDEAVKHLLKLKSDYKNSTGNEWKPTATVPEKSNKPAQGNDNLSEEITKQGDKVRQLKAQKAEKTQIDEAVKHLLKLKSDYKNSTGNEWKPAATVPEKSNKPAQGNDNLSEEITKQGDKVRQLKAQKAEKAQVDEAVKYLLKLKSDYKNSTGNEWKPTAKVPETSNQPAQGNDNLSEEITKQGDKVRQLKAQKAEKAQVDEAVKHLLKLKSDYKNSTGNEWKPAPKMPETTEKPAEENDQLSNVISKQGDTVRQLKSEKAAKKLIDEAVQILLDLKSQYKAATGQDWKPPGGGNAAGARKPRNAAPSEKAAKKEKPKEQQIANKDADSNKTGTRLGLEAKKSENLPDWYSQVITKGEMIEYYDVSGCYILRPWSFSIWDIIKDFFDQEIKKLGVQNCYFPIFVSKAVLEREKTHIADFAPEVAWVTKSGDSELAEPIAIRPTSETVMYPAYAKWLKSYRDLPLKLNQWNNVVRWEFKHPQPFLRTREFLWQEGHSAFATKAEADEEVLIILDLYAKIYEDYLAVPVVKGRKTEKEKFAGGDYTTTVEAFVSASGRAIQGGTSHHLGQNFSKMFDIQVEGAEEGGEKTFVYQNSWGLTTRTIGVMIMVHGDDKGLVLPPKIAAVQAIIVPCGITASTSAEQRKHLMAECEKLEAELKKNGNLKVKGDYRDNYSPGWKFNHWELKGVPVRVELGFKDLEKKQVTLVRRDNSERLTADRSDIVSAVEKLLEDVQKSMFARATKDLNDHIKETTEWKTFCTQLDKKNIILAPFCGETSCEDQIKADSTREDSAEEPGAPSMGAKSLCIPFDQPKTPIDSLKCVHPNCSRKPKFYTLFGRSY